MRWKPAPLGALSLAPCVPLAALLAATAVAGCADAPLPAVPIDHPANPSAAVTPLPEPSTTLASGAGSPATLPADAPPAPAHNHIGHAGHHAHDGGQ